MTQSPKSRTALKIPRWLTLRTLLLGLVVGPTAAYAQVPPKADVKKAPQGEQPVAAQKPGAKSPEPATAEEAAKVLDLRTIPVIEGTKGSMIRTLGIRMYQAPGTPKAAFDFQRQLLRKLGFQESPKGHSDATNVSGEFTKDGFLVRVSTSAIVGDPQRGDWSTVTFVNEGNVALDKLPVPPGVKPFHPTSYEASYTTDAKPTETAAACRKLLLAAGWEPYGETKSPHPGQPDASMQYFKRNAIKLQSWIMTTPAEGGKTLIRYNAELLSADLPAPPDAVDLRYDDSQKKLRFESPVDQIAAIIAFYQQRLPKQGWKATTENPIVDDVKRTQFLVYRNSQMDMLSLDLRQYTGKVEFVLGHQSAAEVAEGERLAKEKAELAQQELAKKNRKINVAIPLPALAKKLKKQGTNKLEFSLATGSGPPTLEALRPHFTNDGWTEKVQRELGKTSGILVYTKEYAKITVSYFDLGLSDVGIEVEGTQNVVLEPQASADQVAQAPPAKKPTTPPGLPNVSAPTPAAPKLGSPKRKVTETPLGEYDLSKYNGKKPTLWISPNGRRVAYLTEKGIVIDGEAKEYDYGVDPDSFAFSPDSKRTAYAARVKRPKSDTNYILVLDGKEAEQSYHHFGAGPVFSPDSKHVVFFGRRFTGKDHENFVVIDGKEGPPQKGFAREMAFTPESKKLVYGVEVEGKERYVIRVQTIDGSEKPVDSTFGPVTTWRNFFYGPAGQLGYYGDSGKGGEKRYMIVYDGKEDPNWFKEIQPRNVVVSGDGKHIAYIAKLDAFEYVVVKDGKPSETHKDIVDRSQAISPDGRRVGYATKDFDKIQAVIDGQASKVYRGVIGITFSPDGKRVGYTAVAGDKWHAVIDGQEGPGYDGLGTMAFSPDSKSVAIGAQLGKREFILLDGQPQINGIVQKGYETTGGPQFGPVGKRLVYRAKSGGKWLLVDAGREQQPYNEIVDHFYFSTDGRHLATIASDDEGEMVVVDGLEGNRYDTVLAFFAGGDVHFDAVPGSPSGTAFHYIAARGDKLLLVEETIQE